MALASASRVRSKPALPRERANATSWLAGSRSAGLRVPPPCAVDTPLCVKSSVTSRHFFHFFTGEMLPFVEWLAEQLPSKVSARKGGGGRDDRPILARSVKLHTNQEKTACFARCTMRSRNRWALRSSSTPSSCTTSVRRDATAGQQLLRNKRLTASPRKLRRAARSLGTRSPTAKVYLPMMSRRTRGHVTCQSFYQERPVSGRARCEQADDGIRDEWMRRFAVVESGCSAGRRPSERDSVLGAS